MAMKSNARIKYKHCPLCESTSISLLKEAECTQHPNYNPSLPSTIGWMRCGDCEHVFTDGYFTDEALEILFSKTVAQQTIGYQVEQQRMISAKMIEKVLPFQSSGRWMDIGAGNGSLLFTASEYGFDAVGVDLRQDNVSQLHELGFEAHCSDFQDLENVPLFNVISMADVLEHMPFPVKALQHVHRLLVDGGVALISMPNTESMIWQFADQSNANPYWAELEHYHNFSRSRLYKLLTDNGFTPARYGISERYRMCMEVIAVKK
jgi:SAM-dependent methyltransferase